MFLGLCKRGLSSLRSFIERRPRRQRAAPRRFRSLLEDLEGRLTPVTWTGGADNPLWSDIRNWSTGRVPTAMDPVVYDNTSVRPSTIDAVVDGSVASLRITAGYTGTITVVSDITVGAFTQEGGTIGGTSSGILTASSSFAWSGGTQSGDPLGGQTIVLPNASLTISGAGAKTLDGRTLENRGTATWSGAGAIQLNSGALFDNQSGSVFTAQNGDGVIGDIDTDGNSANFFTVDGEATFNLATATDVRIWAKSTVVGTVNLTGNNTRLAYLKFFGDVSMGGTFNVSANFELDLWSPRTECQGGPRITGAGTTSMLTDELIIPSGTLLQVANCEVSGTTIKGDGRTGGGTFEVASGYTLQWRSGHMQVFGGNTHISPNATMNLQGPGTSLTLAGWGITNDGTINWTQGDIGFDGATLTNNANARFNINTAGTIRDHSFLGDPSLITNSGRFTRTAIMGAPTTTIEIPFTNNIGGTLEITDGTVSFTKDITQNGGQTLLSGGNLRTSRRFNIAGGTVTVTGSRTITALEVVNAGTIQYAASHGILTIAGDYTQTGFGTLSISIGGAPNQPNLYDQLIVQAGGGGTGVAKLAGTIKARFDPGFAAPGAATVWGFLTFVSLDAMMGQFGNTDFGGINFAVNLGNTSGSITYTP